MRQANWRRVIQTRTPRHGPGLFLPDRRDPNRDFDRFLSKQDVWSGVSRYARLGEYLLLRLLSSCIDPDNRPVAAGHLVTEPAGGFLTRRAVDVVWLPRVEPSTFVADFGPTSDSMSERSLSSRPRLRPVAPVIANNVREALLPSQGQ